MGADLRLDVVILHQNGGSRGTFASAFEKEIRIKADAEGNIVFPGKIIVGVFIAIDGDLFGAERQVMRTIEDIRDLVGTVLIVVSIEQLLDFFWVREGPLQAGNNGKIAKESPRFAGFGEPKFVAERTAGEMVVTTGVCHAGIGAAVEPHGLNARQKGNAIHHHPMRTDIHFVAECVAHMCERNA